MDSLKDILEKIGRRHGIEKLNPMQRAVASAKASRIVLLAPTGSGKTLAFTVPLTERLGESCGEVQAVVMAPSRELVIQISEVIRSVATGYKVTALYGGHSMQDETNALKIVPDIVVATPGRLLDHINRSTIYVGNARQLVLDEYDKALELGFHDQMRRIVRRLEKVKYVTLTSATPISETPDFIDLSQAKVIDYSEKVDAPRGRMTVRLVRSDSRDKLHTLLALIRSLPDGRTIVFVNHRESAERVFEFLKREGIPAGLYHGGLDQLRRELAIDMLNNGTTPVLVSTDLGSRGLDIADVRSVVHYHLPLTPESWTHRNGRTARIANDGDIYILVSDADTIPGYIDYDYEYVPSTDNPDPIESHTATIYFNAGRKEKISKGDLLGFICKQCGVERVGKIVVKDHCAVVGVPRSDAQAVIDATRASKIKGQRVRATLYL